jgi:hypothetical protein
MANEFVFGYEAEGRSESFASSGNSHVQHAMKAQRGSRGIVVLFL